ncbi:hypothetical protein HK102_012678 [Quaeritorhiza haematococci]|nr:hypothetical protein HK102_012678 [Quaeritorhiza haematococci]
MEKWEGEDGVDGNSKLESDGSDGVDGVEEKGSGCDGDGPVAGCDGDSDGVSDTAACTHDQSRTSTNSTSPHPIAKPPLIAAYMLSKAGYHPFREDRIQDVEEVQFTAGLWPDMGLLRSYLED